MLVVTAINGCTDTLTGEVKVVQPPAAFSAAPNIGCGPQLEVSFDYYSIDETVESFTWLFSDQTTDESNDPTVSHTFTGSFSTTVGAMLQVTDRYGCSNTSYVPVDMIVAVSIFQASDPDLCLGESAELILADPDVDWYEIDYGDGTPTSDLLTHTYTQAGTYDVSLSVMKNGCLANTTIPELISVEEADASFSVSDSISDCYPLTVAFTYNGNSEGIASGTWTFAEGVQSQEFSTMPTYTYTYPGTYVSSLEIRTLNDCRASIQKVIEIDGPFAEFTFTPEEICNGGEVAFTLLDTDNTDSFEWLFGDGSTSTDEHPVHTYSVIGDVFPAIHLSRGDCSVTLGGDTLHVSAIDAEFTLNPEKDSYCLDEAIFAINESDEYVTSLWSLNDVIVSNANNLSGIRFTGVGENSISLRVSNLIPCSDTIRKIFHVVPLPEFSIGGDSVICRDAETAQLHITGNSEDWSVLWLPASFVDNPSSFDPMASPDSSTTFTAVATDENQCSASENFDVRVIQPYDVNRSPLGDTVIYIGESLPLSVRSEDTHAKYAWSPPLGISCVTCNNPVVRPLFSTTYTVLISDACFESSYEFPIEVILDYYLEFPDAFSPNADGANDLFHPELKNVREIDLKLFNRWGNLVYHTNELTGSWDGRYQGKLQNPDTYTYYVKAISIHGYEFEKKGSFLLLW
jgi:gliding motility-associated-like protein